MLILWAVLFREMTTQVEEEGRKEKQRRDGPIRNGRSNVRPIAIDLGLNSPMKSILTNTSRQFNIDSSVNHPIPSVWVPFKWVCVDYDDFFCLIKPLTKIVARREQNAVKIKCE